MTNCLKNCLLICGNLALFAFTVFAMLKDFDKSIQCKRSNLWIFLLANLMVDTAAQFRILNAFCGETLKKELESLYHIVMCWSLVNFVILSIELFYASCKSLEGSLIMYSGGLWFALASVIIMHAMFILVKKYCEPIQQNAGDIESQ